MAGHRGNRPLVPTAWPWVLLLMMISARLLGKGYFHLLRSYARSISRSLWRQGNTCFVGLDLEQKTGLVIFTPQTNKYLIYLLIILWVIDQWEWQRAHINELIEFKNLIMQKWIHVLYLDFWKLKDLCVCVCVFLKTFLLPSKAAFFFKKL